MLLGYRVRDELKKTWMAIVEARKGPVPAFAWGG
jgi:hypothetical protein